MTAVRHLLSIEDIPDHDLAELSARARWYASGAGAGHRPLRGRIVGTYFRETSTRTRTAFSTAALRLGADHLAFGAGDLQDTTGESLEDTGRILGLMLDALVVRSATEPGGHGRLCGRTEMPVINAMSADEHPTQALADLATLSARFGTVNGLRVLYVGEGNNTAAALTLALSRCSRGRLVLCTPPGYGLDRRILAVARAHAADTKTEIREVTDPRDRTGDFDVVYTTRWQTTGTTKPTPDWRTVFAPFQVGEELMERHPEAVFMHDLPAHRGEEVTAAVLDGPRSIAFEQARMKMFSAMAVLEWCVAPWSP